MTLNNKAFGAHGSNSSKACRRVFALVWAEPQRSAASASSGEFSIIGTARTSRMRARGYSGVLGSYLSPTLNEGAIYK